MTGRKAEKRCATCGRSFKYRYLLEQHKRVHSGATPFVCKETGCGRSFKWLSSLKAHRKSHVVVKTVGEKFADETSLTIVKSGNSELEGILEDLLENPAAPIEEKALGVISEESDPWKTEDNAKAFGTHEDTNFDACFNLLDMDGTYSAYMDTFLTVIPEQV
eukprot:CAMPEP_0113960430 /NCGR_PEP_ID=MMETSP0011_2-20120614/4706_1 /TAXON_ID=101924 /ORGANISM="Rhodosorus marinus" /LENGTH=161 /DNA_ID=CAMNT_0000971873 /DNA_START=1 /DNA_END=486 /DNA_ORIENTATION=+ /assembly_acc=CAM_ASM_000156